MKMKVNNFSMNRPLLSSYPVTLSVLLTSRCCFFRSLMCQSHLLHKAHSLETGLSLIQSVMRQSHQLCNAHLLRQASLWSRDSWASLICYLMLICSRQASLWSRVSWVSLICFSMLRRACLWSGVSWVSLICWARLICWRRLILWSGTSDANHPLAEQQTTKHNGLYLLLSVSLTVPPFVEPFSRATIPVTLFLCFNHWILSFGFHKWVVHTTFWLSNVAISFDS